MRKNVWPAACYELQIPPPTFGSRGDISRQRREKAEERRKKKAEQVSPQQQPLLFYKHMEGAQVQAEAEREGGRTVRSYFATVVTGLECWALDEIKQKLGVEGVRPSQGKIYLQATRLPPTALKRQIRSVEKFFLSVLFRQEWKPDIPDEPHAASTYLNQLTEQIAWQQCLTDWLLLINSEDEDYEEEEEEEATKNKPCRLRPLNMHDISFRVTCRRSGIKTKTHSSQYIAGCIGEALQQKFNWKVDLTNFDLEVFVNVTDELFAIGLPLQRESLSKREYAQKAGGPALRASIAYCMCRAANIQQSMIVVDPMCGSGKILMEGRQEWLQAHFIGGDNNPQQIKRAVKFLNASSASAPKVAPTELFCWDATALPLNSASVHLIISDIPFGKMHGSKSSNMLLYPLLLKEMNRVLVEGGKAVLLTSMKGLLCSILKKNKHRWKTRSKHFINNGGLDCFIFVLEKVVPKRRKRKEETESKSAVSSSSTPSREQDE
ncbi:THUMP domain-containing protein 3 [Balamuthia mandrillaris]